MRRALLLTLIRCLLAHAHRDEVCAEVGEMCRCKVGQSIIYGRSGVPEPTRFPHLRLNLHGTEHGVTREVRCHTASFTGSNIVRDGQNAHEALFGVTELEKNGSWRFDTTRNGNAKIDTDRLGWYLPPKQHINVMAR